MTDEIRSHQRLKRGIHLPILRNTHFFTSSENAQHLSEVQWPIHKVFRKSQQNVSPIPLNITYSVLNRSASRPLINAAHFLGKYKEIMCQLYPDTLGPLFNATVSTLRRARAPVSKCPSIQVNTYKTILLFTFLLSVGTMSTSAFGQGEPWAGRLDSTNIEQRRTRGPDAIGGLDDYALTNGHLCATVSDLAHDNELSPIGGILIDLAVCVLGNDQLLSYQEILNLSTQSPVTGRKIETSFDEDKAAIVVHGGHQGIAVETTYSLSLDRPNRLRITSRVRREQAAAGDEVFAFAGGMGNIYSLTPFTLSLDEEARSPGFAHRAFLGQNPMKIGRAAAPADIVFAVGSSNVAAGVSYGQQLVSAQLISATGKTTILPHFFFADETASTIAVFSKPFLFGRSKKLSWFELLQTKMMDLDEGDTLVLEQDVWVGDRSDVASVTNMLFEDQPMISGRVNNSDAVIHVDRANGTAFTESKVDVDGRFAVHAPPGEYRLRFVAPGGLELKREVAVETQEVDLGLVDIGARARIALPQNTPMRLVFVGVDGTPDPNFTDDLLGFTIEKDEGPIPWPGAHDVNLMGRESDPKFISLAPGTYKVYATRGPEYSVTETSLKIGEPGAYSLTIEAPVRAIETPGWISADLHIHAGPSFDNSFSVDERIRSFIAQGGEVMVSTEHDVVYDYSDDIARLGASDLMKTVTGVEITSEASTEEAPYTMGHGNAFPFEMKPDHFKNGAPVSEGRRWREAIGELHQQDKNPIVQLNHARQNSPLVDGVDVISKQAFFTHMGSIGVAYDPSVPLSEGANASLIERDPVTCFRDIDFDAMELINGVGMARYYKLREDWFSLLKQGLSLTGTANSDSHTAVEVVALPRMMIAAVDDQLSAFDESAFIDAVRDGQAYGTTGPLIDVTLGEATMGGLYQGREATLAVEISATDWVPVSTLRVFVNGGLVETRTVDSNSHTEVPLSFGRDAFVTIEVEGPPEGVYTEVLPGYVPFAFSNPIYVDADEDGEWTPPGL